MWTRNQIKQRLLLLKLRLKHRYYVHGVCFENKDIVEIAQLTKLLRSFEY